MSLKNLVLRKLRRFLDHLDGERKHLSEVTLRLNTGSGEKARVVVHYDREVDAVEALSTLGRPDWLMSIASELGLPVPRDPEILSDDDFDGDGVMLIPVEDVESD